MIEVLKTGFYSSIQDIGRFGFENYGVPYAGALDNYSARLANGIIGNSENAAVIEITMTGPELQFHSDTQICISGANMSPKLNNKLQLLNKIINIEAGDRLSFGKNIYGFRSYLSVAGGFDTPIVMNSRSMYGGITNQPKLIKGDILSIFNSKKKNNRLNASVKIDQTNFSTKAIEVFKGPEFDLLTNKQKEKLVSQEFTVSKNNNRMAYQLEELLTNSLKPIITSLVIPGTIQLTPHGNLIVLMRDCQTTGGYPRVLQLKESAINKLAQKFTGNCVRFSLNYQKK